MPFRNLKPQMPIITAAMAKMAILVSFLIFIYNSRSGGKVYF
jgi:hypothetical protein